MRWRWLFVVVISIFAFAVEVPEHHIDQGAVLDIGDYEEMLVTVVVVPLMLGLSLSIAARYSRKAYFDEQQNELIRQLNGVREWDEMVAILSRLIRTLEPVTQAALLIHDTTRGGFVPVFRWSIDRKGSMELAPVNEPAAVSPSHTAVMPGAGRCDTEPNFLFCSACALVREPGIRPVSLCRDARATLMVHYPNEYCLPIGQGGQPIALLRLGLRSRVALMDDETAFITNLIPAIALAVILTHPLHVSQLVSAAIAIERKRIARDLHDSLSQKLVFMRMKLEQLALTGTPLDDAALRDDLYQLTEVAQAASQQVRHTLHALRPGARPELQNMLLEQAEGAAKRAGFVMRFTSTGRQQLLPPHVQEHVASIVGEALANVERHARAGFVTVHSHWSDEALTIELIDDGGGFVPDNLLPEGHFGLAIMKERADEIDAHWSLRSAPGDGTQITLHLPLRAAHVVEEV